MKLKTKVAAALSGAALIGALGVGSAAAASGPTPALLPAAPGNSETTTEAPGTETPGEKSGPNTATLEQGDHTTPSAPDAEQPGTTPDAPAAEQPGNEAPDAPGDGPGGHADGPGTADDQFTGTE